MRTDAWSGSKSLPHQKPKIWMLTLNGAWADYTITPLVFSCISVLDTTLVIFTIADQFPVYVFFQQRHLLQEAYSFSQSLYLMKYLIPHHLVKQYIGMVEFKVEVFICP